jgi:hypothetical protein
MVQEQPGPGGPDLTQGVALADAKGGSSRSPRYIAIWQVSAPSWTWNERRRAK